MTNSKSNSIKTSNKRQAAPVVNCSLPEVIEAVTPLFLATIGAVIGVVVLVQPMGRIDDTRATAGLGLAGTAIAGAAGLARTGRSQQDFSVKQQDGNLEVDTPADR
ncbi:hypothetical protein [Pleurocapsa sp. PCC 7319]|uniref:hypothetical protein n=1 Tax=Pleurocapsa sp. PCC 7319 TaxID=118161 RepID=UPI00034A75BE|nr:hypothetical protein [Pleurocapsa sp. PCC 7319]